jgi:hypothetical protein
VKDDWKTILLSELLVEGPTNGYSGPTGPDAIGTLTLRLSATTSGSCVLNGATTKRLYETIPTDSDLWLEPGDLLVQRSNTIDLVGTAAIYDGPSRAYIYPDLMMRLRTHELATARFIWRYMNSPAGRSFFSRMAAGSSGSMPKVSGAKLRTMEIPLPLLAEQRRIAEVLDRAEALRAKRRAALAELDSLTQSLFLDLFGDPVTNPKGWPESGIEDVCELIVDCVNRTAPIVDGPTPFKMIRTTNVKAGKVNLAEVRYVTEETFKQWNRRTTPKRGDVLLTREAPVGEAGMLESDDSVFLGQRLMLYRTNRERMQPEYLLAAFRGSFLQQQFDRHGSGSTVKHLPLPACRSFQVHVPPIALQQEFARRVGAVEKLKAAQRTALAEQDALFAALQHRAFRGEL